MSCGFRGCRVNNPHPCVHGSLHRQCLVCELEAENQRLREALERVQAQGSEQDYCVCGELASIAKSALEGK